jgi:hypothetical protein
MWAGLTGGAGSSTLAGDSDVSLSGPAAGQHLAYNGSVWVNAAPSKLQLNYNAATDLLSSTSLSAATWTDVGSNQSFTVDDANSTVEITIGGALLVGNVNIANVGIRLVIDSAGTPVTKVIGGQYVDSASTIVNQFAGCSPAKFTGLSAASHTVKVQVNSDAANTAWCRPSTKPDSEALLIQVWEAKR